MSIAGVTEILLRFLVEKYNLFKNSLPYLDNGEEGIISIEKVRKNSSGYYDDYWRNIVLHFGWFAGKTCVDGVHIQFLRCR